ncbi:MAG: aerobic carbon-monoxide dehydrogenase small subunit [Mycobacterium sp.]|nr:aerobic carbon-monoxide dehydrogenase small subunit [Mycobacterium sp.]
MTANGVPATRSVQLTVNGQPHTVEVHYVDDMLVDFLRDQLGLVDVKIGCREGACGACTVLIDGAAVTSCLVYVARAGGTEIATASHLLEEPLGERIGAAFVRNRAMQCGYCTPGMVVCAYGYLDATSSADTPDRAALADAFRGHLCRCTGYTRILDAVSEVAQNSAGDGTD